MKRITTKPLPPIIYQRYDEYDLGGWFMLFAIICSAAIIVGGTVLAYILLC